MYFFDCGDINFGKFNACINCIWMLGGKKGFKKSPSTNIIILDQYFWIVEVN